MKVTGMRAAQATVDAMEAAGLGRDVRRDMTVEGWIRPNYMNSLGYGIRKLAEGGLEWNLVLSGRRHLRYETVRFDEDSDETEEPVHPEALHGRIKAVYEGLGLKVLSVRTSGYSGMWDDDVKYTVSTPHPEWLEAYDPKNALPAAPDPILTGFLPTEEGRLFGARNRGDLPGYGWAGKAYLTRESIDALVETAASDHAKVRLRLDADGTLTLQARDRPAHVAPMQVIENHWGDAVEAWRMPPGLLRRVPLRDPAVPFLAGGEMREGPSFKVVDAQFGEAPWAEPDASTPRP